jgi:nucleoside-diphosphate-sugar epimerase
MGRILIIGGNRFVGYQLVWRLVAAGEQVTTLNRGNISDPFTNRIERLHADRTSPAFANALRGRNFDAVVDFAAFNAADTQGVVEVLKDRVGHYVFISSGAVYMVREGAQIPCSDPLPETAYAGDVSIAPTTPEDLPSWRYGTGKRAAEDVMAAAWKEHRFPATCLRLPTVNGVGDPERRIESYLWRILDGGPVLLPGGGNNKTRHVYSGDVVKAIVNLLGRQSTFGDAFNLSQDEQPTLRELVWMLTEIVGAPNRSQSVARSTLERAGLSSRTVSPFSGRWASCLDPTRAKEELGFRHEPLMQYLDKIVAAFLSHPPVVPPDDYVGRTNEVELGLHLSAQG